MRCLALTLLLAYSGMWLATKTSPFDISNYNSYSIQAKSWLEGRLDVDHFSWLEQAVFEGRYYISFPPMPSVIMLPFVLVFGAQTPDNLICLAVAIAGACYALKTARALGKAPRESFFWALFVTVSSNFLFISMNGWVWFIAQNLSFMFTMMSIFYAVDKRRKSAALSLLFLACAVGCRPFQLVFFPVLFFLLYDNSSIKAFLGDVLHKWYSLLPVLCVGLFYCALNYARFGNILEFGHNYLPEFLESPMGQFNTGYIPYNFLRSVRLFEYRYGQFFFPVFDGFAFYIVMPVWISCAAYLVRGKKLDGFAWLALVCIALNLLATCAHKTMGGWQFGCRYFVDATPFVLLLALKRSKDMQLSRLDYALIIFGAAVNILGNIAFYLEWLY